MAMSLPLGDARAAWRTGRAEHRARPPRTPLIVKLARFAARRLPSFAQARRIALSLGGFSALTASAWTLHTAAGLAAAGVSLLVLEYLAGGE